MDKKRIAIFASGSGTNAENIAKYFADHPTIAVAAFLTNNPKAYVIQRAEQLAIPVRIFNRMEFYDTPTVLDYLIAHKTDYVVLAGFLWLVPTYLIHRFSDRIINIHPALLPKYGGKGMYGSKVHEAVVASGDVLSGITIHLVNEEYDKGRVLFQASCKVLPHETPESLAGKIHQLEYEHFPRQIETYILSK